MVTNIDTGRDEDGHLEPLMIVLFVLVLLAVAAVGFFMWTSYARGGIPQTPADIKITFKHMPVGRR